VRAPETTAALPSLSLTPTTADPTLTVVVMAYNEAATVEATVCEIATTLTNVEKAYEILIVDDGSSDGTSAIADDLATSMPSVRVIHHAPNAGLGGVYRTGFREARGELITFFPADGQFPASIIEQFVPLTQDVDMVLGYLPDRRSSLVAKGLSFIERALYRALFGYFPTFQGVLMFRRRLLRELPLLSEGRGWAVLMELIIRAGRGDYRLVSAPTTMRPRRSGTSKVNNLRTIMSNTRQMFALRRLLS